MTKKQRQELILQLLQQKEWIKVGEIIDRLKVERTTVYRDFQELLKSGKVQEIGKWKYHLVRINPLEYLQTPFFQRSKKFYNFDFLASYQPNQTSFFSANQLKTLHHAIKGVSVDTDFFINNKRLLETILIDLSFSSSYLEWNTYDYLDTEVLIKYNEIAKDKSQDDTQMILNHKKCIEYMVYYKKELPFSAQTVFEIHTLLGEKLLPKEQLGVVRNKIVEIGASTYTPLDNQHQLREEFDQFLKKLNAIHDPFEQSLFCLVFLSYFQLFMDGNKRVSRMIANLVLLKYNLPLISFLAVERKTFITAILAVYELNDVSLLSQIFVDNYLLNIERYE